MAKPELFICWASRPRCIRVAWLGFVYLGATGSLRLVWDVADTLNGLMAIPNLIGLLASIPLLLRLQRDFFSRPQR
jgi:AGCS family alanine or glycine:cation symporter